MPKSIMIIGAGPGIGLAVAEKFGREGWTTILSGRNAERLDLFVAGLSEQGITAHAVPADASDPIALRAAIAEGERITGGLTVILYNAAMVRHQDLFGMSDEDIIGDLAINVAGGLYAIRDAVALFGQRGGTILVTGGILGVSPNASYASLGAGKAALRNIVLGLAGPLSKAGIRMATVTVGTLVTPGSSEASDVASIFWSLATEPDAAWEIVYPVR